jgi:hypothetical protein
MAVTETPPHFCLTLTEFISRRDETPDYMWQQEFVPSLNGLCGPLDVSETPDNESSFRPLETLAAVAASAILMSLDSG